MSAIASGYIKKENTKGNIALTVLIERVSNFVADSNRQRSGIYGIS